MPKRSTLLMNLAERIFNAILEDGRTFDVRLNADRTSSILLRFLTIALMSQRAQWRLEGETSGRRKPKRKKGTDEAEFIGCLEEIKRKITEKGFTSVISAFSSIRDLIEYAVLSGTRDETCYKMAFDIKKFLDRTDHEISSNLIPVPGYCCTKVYRTQSRPLACQRDGCMALISFGDKFWELNINSVHAVICDTCYGGKKTSEFIFVKERMSDKSDICNDEWITRRHHKFDFKRSQLKQFEITEPVQKCVLCRGEYHAINVMYDEFNWKTSYQFYAPLDFDENFRAVFVCNNCMMVLDESTERKQYQTAIFHPSIMKTTKLSRSMERFLRDSFNDDVVQELSPYDFVNNKIYVREVSSRRGIFEAKTKMREEFRKNGRPSQWVYKQRSIMLFQERPDLKFPIALFNLIVNEYPSTGYVSISYIDSVKLFEPPEHRRLMFQRLVLAYIEYVRCLGYKYLTIWVCPPNEGDEYVFYGRDQKAKGYVEGINEGIIRWYREILDTGIKTGIVNDYSNFKTVDSYLDIPYLADDYWPVKLEDFLIAYQREMHEFISDRGGNRKKKGVPVQKPRPKTIDERVEELQSNFTDMEVLFHVVLEPVSECPNVAEKDVTKDEIDVMCPYMSNRDNFIIDCRANQNDFLDARRAQFTSMKLCSRIAKESTTQSCTYCKSRITTGYYCHLCTDANYCKDCFLHHEHRKYMRKFKVLFSLGDTRPNPIFQTILKHLAGEAEWLTRLAHEQHCLPEKSVADDSLKKLAIIIKLHTAMFNRNHQSHNQTSCAACAAAFLPLIRHKEFCRGNACHVPACSSRPPFNNAGVIHDR